MKNFQFLLFFAAVFTTNVNRAQTQVVSLPIFQNKSIAGVSDWLITPINAKAEVYKSADSKNIVLSNGLLKRTFRVQPNLTCIDYSNLSSGQQLLRAIEPEAIVYLNGKAYNIGGLHGQKERAYLQTQWIDGFTAGDSDFHFVEMKITPLQPSINWKVKTPISGKTNTNGKMISFMFKSSLNELKDIIITVQYALYEGIPLLVKSLNIENKSSFPIDINRVINERLALVEEESAVVGSPEQMKKQHGIYVETNYAFNNAMRYDISDQTTHWNVDPAYTSQVNYNYQTPCLLEVYPEKLIRVTLKPNETFKSVRTHELLMDSYDRERRGLAIRKMYRVVAPWVMANPIFMHLVSANDQQVRDAIDQCAATGYEALILSFGSHCNMEDTSENNIQRWKNLSQYAHQKNILIGGYSLFSSRRISDEDDVIDPITGKPDAGAFFGNAPCLGSKWGLKYLKTLQYFITETGFDIFENDGPYPGDVCASTKHPGHKDLDDSQWKQMELQKGFYKWCNERGVYINAPDWYFLDGTHKTGIGYREVNFSLSRAQQKILNRQNIYDGLWEKTPSMGWGFVPLTKYQGGGADAVLEPLSEHLNDYEQLMMQYYGAGVQACYRGPRLYDTEETKQTVIKVINWYKKYRDILNSDIIHLRRADGRDWDGIMHVNPDLPTKALVLLFNPLKESITRTITLPLNYTGLKSKVMVREKEGKVQIKQINTAGEIKVEVTIQPEGNTWIMVNG